MLLFIWLTRCKEQISAADPRISWGTVKVRYDGGQCDCDNGLIQSGQKHGEHHYGQCTSNRQELWVSRNTSRRHTIEFHWLCIILTPRNNNGKAILWKNLLLVCVHTWLDLLRKGYIGILLILHCWGSKFVRDCHRGWGSGSRGRQRAKHFGIRTLNRQLYKHKKTGGGGGGLTWKAFLVEILGSAMTSRLKHTPALYVELKSVHVTTIETMKPSLCRMADLRIVSCRSVGFDPRRWDWIDVQMLPNCARRILFLLHLEYVSGTEFELNQQRRGEKDVASCKIWRFECLSEQRRQVETAFLKAALDVRAPSIPFAQLRHLESWSNDRWEEMTRKSDYVMMSYGIPSGVFWGSIS